MLLLQIPARHLAGRWSAKPLVSVLLVTWGISECHVILIPPCGRKICFSSRHAMKFAISATGMQAEKSCGLIFEGPLRCAAGLVTRRWPGGLADDHFGVDQEAAALHLPTFGWNESFERQASNLLPRDVDRGESWTGVPGETMLS